MAVRTAYDPTAGEVLTATNLEKLAGGWIGYAEVTADQSTITTEVDLTGLTVAVTVGPSRRIRITAVGRFQSSLANAGAAVAIKEGGTQLQGGEFILGTTSVSGTFVAQWVGTPSTGAHTYKLAMAAFNGGTVALKASATAPAFIVVDDLGPAA